jgi:hypothetical protein
MTYHFHGDQQLYLRSGIVWEMRQRHERRKKLEYERYKAEMFKKEGW